MSNSPTLGKLFERIANAQKRMKAASKDATNPHYKSKYADLASIEEALVPFAEEGVARLQLVTTSDDDSVRVVTVLGCPEGEFIQTEASMKQERPGPHALGSAVTYLRRYTMSAACCLAQDDDDGNAAMPAPKPANTQTAKTPAPAAESSSTKIDATSLKVLKSWMSQVLGAPTAADKAKWLEWVKVNCGLEVASLGDLPQSAAIPLVEAARVQATAMGQTTKESA